MKMYEADVAEAIEVAMEEKVNMISISLIREFPAKYVGKAKLDLNLRDETTLHVTMGKILVIFQPVITGNMVQLQFKSLPMATNCSTMHLL